MAVMRLVEQGALDLRAPVRKYLPGFHVQDEAASREVTLWHLLTHTSGWEGQLSAVEHGDETLERFVAGLSTNMQLAPPGAAWSYNNAGFAVAGRVIEAVTAKPFSEAIDDPVFRPLGLSRAFTRVGDIVTHRFALGHRSAPTAPPPWCGPFTLGSTPPGGRRRHVDDDLLAYARFHLGDAPAPARVVTGRRSRRCGRRSCASGLRHDMGLGWHLRTVGNIRTAAHGGTFAGHILLLELVPEKNLAWRY